jgi:hypothetical protein
MKRLHLIPDWKQAWRWFSVQASFLNMAFLATWALLPPRFQNAIPEEWVFGIAIGLLVLGVAGRVVDQTKPADGSNP